MWGFHSNVLASSPNRAFGLSHIVLFSPAVYLCCCLCTVVSKRLLTSLPELDLNFSESPSRRRQVEIFSCTRVFLSLVLFFSFLELEMFVAHFFLRKIILFLFGLKFTLSLSSKLGVVVFFIFFNFYLGSVYFLV